MRKRKQKLSILGMKGGITFIYPTNIEKDRENINKNLMPRNSNGNRQDSWKVELIKTEQEEKRKIKYNSTICVKSIEYKILKSSHKESPRPNDSVSKFYQTLKEEIISTYTNSFRR